MIEGKCQGANCRRSDAPSEAAESHTCPFATEIHDDHSFECTCCEGCERECSEDI